MRRNKLRLLLLVLGLCAGLLTVLLTVKLSITTSCKPGPVIVPDPRAGFVFGLQVSEQITNGAYNVMNLQCWASTVNLEVVEPSIRDIGADGDQVFYFTQDYQTVKPFRGLFDIEQWNKYSEERHYVPLRTMETFLEKASRNIIFVEINYHSSTKLCHKGVSCTGAISRGKLSTFGSQLYNGPYSFLYSHGFRIVRHVCIELLHDGRLRTQKEFNELVFGDLQFGHGNFTVIFAEWRGIRNESEKEGMLENVIPSWGWYRILIKDSPCHYFVTRHGDYDIKALRANYKASALESTLKIDISALKTQSELSFIPSWQVLSNAAKYRDRYMNNKRYIAIMMRMELLKNAIGTKESYAKCLETVVRLWKYASENLKYEIHETFITSDLGKYGSYSWDSSSESSSNQYHQDVLDAVGLPQSYLEKRDKNLKSILYSNGRVAVAWTQAIIAAQARCIIFIGGGAYQGLIANIHSAMYKGKECFVFVNEFCEQHSHIGLPRV